MQTKTKKNPGIQKMKNDKPFNASPFQIEIPHGENDQTASIAAPKVS
jgi:hypothetical protein